MLAISDGVVEEGHTGSAATRHDAAQKLCLALTSLTAGEVRQVHLTPEK